MRIRFRACFTACSRRTVIRFDPKRAAAGAPLAFEFPVRFAKGPKLFGDQVRREGPERRFVYVRVGQSAGDHASPWSRRMKIDIHDLTQETLEESGGERRRSRDQGRRDEQGWLAGLRYCEGDRHARGLRGKKMGERFERHRQPWRQDEIQKLHVLAGKGMALKAIAKALTRSEESVKDRAKFDRIRIVKLR